MAQREVAQRALLIDTSILQSSRRADDFDGEFFYKHELEGPNLGFSSIRIECRPDVDILNGEGTTRESFIHFVNGRRYFSK